MKKRTLIGLMAAMPLTSLLSACGSGSGSSAKVRLINASAGYSSLDLYVEDDLEISAVAFANASSYKSVDSGTVTTALTVAGSGTELLTQSRTLESDNKYAIVAYGWEGALKSAIISEEEDTDDLNLDSGDTAYRVLNLATDAGTLDVYLTAEDDDLASATPVRSGATAGSSSAFSTVDSGTYRLRVTANDDTDDLRLDVSGVVLPSKGIMTLILTPTTGGVLVNGMMMKQGDDLTQELNTQARVRVVAAVAGGAKVTAAIGDTTLTSNLISPGIQDPYVLVTAGSVTVNISVDGTTLAQTTLTLAAGSDTTLLVTGTDAASAVVTAVTDDNRLPTSSTKYKMRMIHVSNTLASSSVNLTVSLSPVVSNLNYLSASDYVNKTSNSAADVLVTSASTGDTIYEKSDSAALSLDAQAVYTMFVIDKIDGTAQGLFLQER